MGMPMERILPLWQNYLGNVAARRDEFMFLPNSTILEDEPSFQRFIGTYSIPIQSLEE